MDLAIATCQAIQNNANNPTNAVLQNPETYTWFALAAWYSTRNQFPIYSIRVLPFSRFPVSDTSSRDVRNDLSGWKFSCWTVWCGLPCITVLSTYIMTNVIPKHIQPNHLQIHILISPPHCPTNLQFLLPLLSDQNPAF